MTVEANLKPPRQLGTFLLLMFGITIKGAGSSYFLAYQSLVMEARGWSHGLNGTAHAFQIGAVMLVALSVPWLLRRMTVAGGILLASIMSITGFHWVWWQLQAEAVTPIAYFAARLLVGLGIGASYLLGETWLNSLTQEKHRATLLSIYGACLGGGLGMGPMFLPLTGAEGYLPTAFASLTIASLAGVVAYLFHQIPHLPYLSMRKAWRSLFLSPTALVAATVFGMMDACLLTLAPLYGLEVGLSNTQALGLVLAGNAGAVALVVPLGWLADRLHRRKLLALCALLASLCSGLMLTTAHPWLLNLLFFLWGGCFAMFYILALAMLGTHFQKDHMALASMTVILMYGVGSLLGPALGGMAMDLLGSIGMPLIFAGFCGLCLCVTMLRMRKETLR